MRFVLTLRNLGVVLAFAVFVVSVLQMRSRPAFLIALYLMAFSDAVPLLDVLERVEDRPGFFRKLGAKATYRILHLAPGRSRQTILHGARILITRSQISHARYLASETTLATLDDAGYRVLDHSYTGISAALPPADWRARLMRLPGKLLLSVNEDPGAGMRGVYSPPFLSA